MVRFPDEVIAEFRPSDRILDKFVCRATVSVGVFSLEIADKVKQELLILHADLEKGLSIAVTDPVTRYSKAKIEQTLKLALGRHLGSSELASVTMHSLKQRRVVVAPSKDNDEPDPVAVPTAEPISVPTAVTEKTQVEIESCGVQPQ